MWSFLCVQSLPFLSITRVKSQSNSPPSNVENIRARSCTMAKGRDKSDVTVFATNSCKCSYALQLGLDLWLLLEVTTHGLPNAPLAAMQKPVFFSSFVDRQFAHQQEFLSESEPVQIGDLTLEMSEIPIPPTSVQCRPGLSCRSVDPLMIGIYCSLTSDTFSTHPSTLSSSFIL